MAIRGRVLAADVLVIWRIAANAEKLKWEPLATRLVKGLLATTYCRFGNPNRYCLSLCLWGE